ncbi:MAG: alpha-ribazole phosphatase family protein [Pseudomonadota bacterium]
MALTLLRHTTPNIAPDVCYGITDIDVTETFYVEAGNAAALLTPPQRIISSPLKRCQKLAHHIAAQFSLAVETDMRLAEMDFGRWEGMKWSAIARSELDAWAADFLDARPHGGESVMMLYARASAALADYRENDTLLVTHSGIIKCALASNLSPAGLNTQIAFGASVSPLATALCLQNPQQSAAL